MNYCFIIPIDTDKLAYDVHIMFSSSNIPINFRTLNSNNLIKHIIL